MVGVTKAFNYPSLDWITLSGGNKVGSMFVNLGQDCFLIQYMPRPTRKETILKLWLSAEGAWLDIFPPLQREALAKIICSRKKLNREAGVRKNDPVAEFGEEISRKYSLHMSLLNMCIWPVLSRWLHALIPLKTTHCKFTDCGQTSRLFIIKLKSIKKAANPNKTNKASSILNSFIGIAVVTKIPYVDTAYTGKIHFLMEWLMLAQQVQGARKGKPLFCWNWDSLPLTLTNYLSGSSKSSRTPCSQEKETDVSGREYI